MSVLYWTIPTFCVTLPGKNRCNSFFYGRSLQPIIFNQRSNLLKKINISYIKYVALVSLMCFACMSVNATDFDDIVDAILGADRQLELANLQSRASADALKASNVLPDPEAEVEYLRSKSGEEKFNLTVAQSFDWPGVYGARKRQIEIETAALTLSDEAARNEQRMKLRGLLIDIIAANQTIERLSAAVADSDRLLETLEREYGRGNISILEVNKMRITAADFQLKLAEAKTNKDRLTGELTASVEDVSVILPQCDALMRFPLSELAPVNIYVEAAMDKDPSLLAARNQSLSAKAGKDVAARSSLPGFSVGYRLSQEGGELFNGFTAGVSVPLWRASKERHAAASREISAMFGEKTEEIRLQKRIESLYCNAVSLKVTISQYGKALAASDNAGLLKRAYEAGATTLTEYVLDMNYFVEADVQYVELQRQYYNILAELSRYDEYMSR